MTWWIWVVIGILIMICEIFASGFILFSIGIGAIIAGLFALSPIFSLPFQLFIFAITSTTSFLLMKKFSKFLLKPTNAETNIYALVGKTGIVVQPITPTKKGYVKIEGEEWSAVAEDPELTLMEGSVVEIVKTEGNKVIVKNKDKGV